MARRVRYQLRIKTGEKSPLGSIISIRSLLGRRFITHQTEADRARAQGTLAEILHARKSGGKEAQSAKIKEILSRDYH